MTKSHLLKTTALSSLLGALGFMGEIPVAAPALAQSATEALQERIVITARKRSDAEDAQDVPLAVTAFDASQLDAIQVRDLGDLSFSVPNVVLEDIGTLRGTANFVIRGLGVNSSIPSIDPAVSVIRDGVVLGSNVGVVLDIFDLQSVEVLRGPQGVLFGRNATGGAVVLNSRAPTYEFEAGGRVAVESAFQGTGINSFYQGYVSGPLVEDRLLFKVSAYYNNDDGYFENQFNGENLGRASTFAIRPSLTWLPSDTVKVDVRYEFLDSENDGPAAQSHTNGLGIPGTPVNFDRETLDVAIDETGFGDFQSHFLSAQAEIDVPFGIGGQVTNIFGWRHFEAVALADIDAQPVFLFHSPTITRVEQFSNELRYFGRFFDRVDLTAGVFYFKQDLSYDERRDLVFGALTQTGGGLQTQETVALFANGDIDLSDRWILSLGLRATREHKDAQVATLSINVNNFCSVDAGTCDFDFEDDDFWMALSPRIGLQYDVDDDTLVYAQWARSFRSGGYNLRNTSLDLENLGPGPFDEEEVDSYELGVKSNFFGGLLNGAVFFTQVSDMQREVNLSDPVAGVVQVIRNTADADIFGIEVELQYPILDNLLFLGSVGYLDGDYNDVVFDLNSDGEVNALDEELDIPRLAPLSYNVGLVYDQDVADIGTATFRINYAFRDQVAFTDNNLGILNEGNILDASIALTAWQDRARVSLYGRNLLNDVQHGNDTQLPAALGGVPLGGTFAPLAKGRIIGLEFQIDLQ